MGLESVTPIKDLTTLSHRDTMIRQSIKTARGVPLRVAKISQRDVLEGIFPNFTFPHMPHHPNVLVCIISSLHLLITYLVSSILYHLCITYLTSLCIISSSHR